MNRTNNNLSADPSIAERESEVLDLEERQWLPNHCRGDESAFARLVAAYGELLYTFLRRHGLAQSTADDVFQEVLLKVHLAADSYQPSRPLKPWLFTLANNTLRNHYRSESRRKGRIGAASDRETAELRSEQPGPADAVDTQARVAWLEVEIGRLPSAQREVMVLATISGLKMSEIAQILKQPVNTVKTHLHRARKHLSDALNQRECAGERNETV